MPTEQRLLFNEQVTIRMPNVLLNRVDSLAQTCYPDQRCLVEDCRAGSCSQGRVTEDTRGSLITE